MWIIVKYKKKEFNFLKQDFKKTLGGLPLFFRPRIKYQKLIKNKSKFIERDILGDYLICYHEKFKSNKILSLLNNSFFVRIPNLLNSNTKTLFFVR